MPDAGGEWRIERKSEIWERAELMPISVQQYLEELNELSKELAESGCGCGSGCDRRLGTTRSEERYIIREYYTRKGHESCECGRSVDESVGCRRDVCKYDIPRHRSFK